MKFTNAEFKKMRQDINKALEEVGKKYDIQLEAGNLTYSDIDFTLKLKGTKTDAGNVEQIEFERYCMLYGFKKEEYNKPFKLQGQVYRLVGFKPKARKNTCIFVAENGNKYVGSDEMVRRLMDAYVA